MTTARLLFSTMLLASLASCADRTLTDPRAPTYAKGGASGDPTVTGTSPTGAGLDTTLDVRVFGTNFDRGSRADLALGGVVGPGVHTNSTRYVSTTELVANVTITAAADTGAYDVMVTASTGKKGIGTELFQVRKGRPAPVWSGATPELLPSVQGTGETQARAISNGGWILGVYYKSATSVLTLSWDPLTLQEQIVVDPGSVYGSTSAHGDAFGNSSGPKVYLASGITTGWPYRMVSLDLPAGASPGNVLVDDMSDTHLVLGDSYISSSSRDLLLWLPNETSHDLLWWSPPLRIPLPTQLYPGAVASSGSKGGVNELGEIAGTFTEYSNGPSHAWLWRLEGTGTAAVIIQVGELPRYGGATEHAAADINEAGVVAGGVRIGPDWYPAIWFPVGGELPHRYQSPPAVLLEAKGWSNATLNRCGWMAGSAVFASTSLQAFIWDGKSAAVLLRPPAGVSRTNAKAINDRGDVVGWSAVPLDRRTTVGRATRWIGAVAPCP